MANPLIDPAAWRDLQDTAGADFAAELAGIFIEEMPGMLADARDAFTSKDATAIARAAHSLKSNALTFGATRLAALARALELGGLAQADAAALQALEAAAVEAARALEALRHG